MLKILLFWVHVLVGVFGATMGFYFSLPVVLGLVILHRLHLIVFDGCAITRLQQHLGHFPRQVDFLEVVAKELAGREISPRQAKTFFNYAFGILPVLVAIVRFYI